MTPFIPPVLTAEGFIPPRSQVDSTILTFIDVGFNGLTENDLGSIQLTQVKETVPEETLNTSKYHRGRCVTKLDSVSSS